MKNVFGMIIDKEGKNRRTGEELLYKTLDGEMTSEVRKFMSESDKKMKKVVPFWMGTVSYLILLVFLIFAALFITRGIKEGFQEALHKYYFFLIGAGVSLLIYIFLFVYTRLRNILFLKSDEYKKINDKLNELSSRIEKELSIPEDVIKCDIFKEGLFYNEKKELENVKKGYFINMQLSVFQDDNKIYFSDYHDVFALDKTVISYHEINECCYIDSWNKKESYRDKKYKEYHIKEVQNGYQLPGYYQVIFSYKNEEYELLFPLYEKEKILSLLGIKE